MSDKEIVPSNPNEQKQPGVDNVPTMSQLPPRGIRPGTLLTWEQYELQKEAQRLDITPEDL